MELVQELYDFFGIELLTESATFTDLLNNILIIALALWITVFIIRSVFLACTLPNRNLF